ncbi:MAG: CRISPR-associated endonuclease Cas3'' [Chloroflexota bacterium]
MRRRSSFSIMRELISHPDVPLHDHLRDVGGRAASILLDLKSHLKLQIPAEELAKAAFVAGICHDFGKAKKQFQDYIYNGKAKAKNKEHAAISSVFTFVVASKVFDRKRQPTRLLPFVCAYAVNRHHGLLCNLEKAFEEAVIEHQIAVSKGKIDDRLWGFQFHYGEPLNLTIKFSEYRDSFEKVKADQIVKQFQCFRYSLGKKAEAQDASENWPLDLYLALLLIISTLTEADVACVISAPEPGPAKVLDPEIIYRYACNQPSVKGKLQELRQDAWKELVEEKLEFAEDSACRLTLPTGLGKTLMGLYLAGKLQKPDHTNPVIYALPYLSIIEQATDVARSVFSKSSVSVIQHHSLSFPASGQEEAPNFEQARFILEDWQADLVITTFDQLLYSFLTRDRGFIRRFFRLPGAVLLLDEVQTIPYRLIPAIETFLNKLNEKLGTRIIYMTATHPPFLKTSHPMIQNESEYFSSLNRTRLRLQLTPISFSKYLSELGQWLLDRKGKKILLVANTIRSARDLFQHLKKLKENRYETVPFIG